MGTGSTSKKLPAMQLDANAIEIDRVADAAYVRLSSGAIARTEEINDGIVVDFDADDGVVGVEVLGLRDRVGAGDDLSFLRGLVAGLRAGPIRAAAE
jgi:uncharacterized protein YuzE